MDIFCFGNSLLTGLFQTDLESANLETHNVPKDFQGRLDGGSAAANQESPSIQLEFTYEQTAVSKVALQTGKPDVQMVIRHVVKQQSDGVSPDDLNQKIAAVKNVWDRDSPSSQRSQPSGGGSLFASADLEQESSRAGGAEKNSARAISKNEPTAPTAPCFGVNSGGGKDSGGHAGIQLERSYPSNVAKVRPQPQQIPQQQQAAMIAPIGPLKEMATTIFGGNAMTAALNFQNNYGISQQQQTLPSPIHAAVSNVASLFAPGPLIKQQDNTPMQLGGYAAAPSTNVGGGFIMPSGLERPISASGVGGGFIVPSGLERPMSASGVGGGANWPLPPPQSMPPNQPNGAYMMGQPTASGHSSVGFGRPPSNPAAAPAPVGSMFMLPLIPDTSQPPPPLMNFSQPPLPPPPAPLMGPPPPSMMPPPPPHGPPQSNPAAPMQIQSMQSAKGTNFMLAPHATQPIPPQTQYPAPVAAPPFVNHPPGPIQPPIGTQSAFAGAKRHELGGSQAPGFGRKGGVRNAGLATSSSSNQQEGLLGPVPGSQRYSAAAPMLNVIQPIAPAGAIGIGNVPGFGVPPQLFDRGGGMNVSNGRATAANAVAPSLGYSHPRSTYYKQDQRRDKDLLQVCTGIVSIFDLIHICIWG